MRLEISDEEVLQPVISELNALREEVKAERKVLMHLLALSGQKVVWKISDIAEATGYSYEFLRTGGRYLLPRFGESAYSSGAARWPLSECLEWMAKPDEEKRKAYQEHVRQQMRAESRKRNAAR